MTDSYTMSAPRSSRSSSTRTIALKRSDLIRLCMSASTLEIFGPQNERSVTWPQSLQKPSGDKATDDESPAALPAEEPKDPNDRERQATCEVSRRSVYAEAGGLRYPGEVSCPGDQTNTWLEQEINRQLSELGQIDPQQGLREGERHDHQQACERHKELGDVARPGSQGLPLD